MPASAQAPCLGGGRQPPPQPCRLCKRRGKKPAKQRGRGSGLAVQRGARRGVPEAAPSAAVGGGREPYLLQMLQWWVRAGLGAMHFLQTETPVRPSLACA